MHIGLCLPQLGGHVNRHGLRAFCEQAEELGYGSLWVQEHIFYPLHPVSGYSARVDELCEEVARSRALAVGKPGFGIAGPRWRLARRHRQVQRAHARTRAGPD